MSGDHREHKAGAKPGFNDARKDDAPLLEPKIQQQLGLILRQHSQDLLNQPVPDSFLALLARLEARERETR